MVSHFETPLNCQPSDARSAVSDLPSKRSPKPPRLVLNILSSLCSKDLGKQYILEPNGMLGSPRVFNSTDITIGRQQITDSGMRPNDIMLSSCDSFISRTHCKIRYNEGMHTSLDLSPSIWSFLLGTHSRLGQHSPIQHLPTHLLSEILSYLKPARRFFISDSRSVTGTYLKLRHRMKLTHTSLFLIQPHLGFTVVILRSPENMLKHPKLSHRLVHPSSDSWQLNTLISILMLQGSPSVSMSPSGSYWFAASRSPYFYIGENSEIPVDIKGRIKISYEDGWWVEDLGTDFGVWVSTSGLRGCESRFVEREVELISGDLVKISETVIKVEW
jgi:pSer/pThr/pTyr-binding forkhead associated (FHA) protein